MEFDEVREILKPLSQAMVQKSESNKEDRDHWNAEVRGHLDERNEVNRQVKELINEVQSQKSVRDEINNRVKELKELRAKKSEHLKAVREELRGKLAEQEESRSNIKRSRGPPPGKIRLDMERLEKQYMTGQFLGKRERDYHKKMKELSEALRNAEKERGGGEMRGLKDAVRSAEASQEEAHKSVESSVSRAQEAHDLMVELSEEVDRLREKANSAHGELNKSKREADALHSQYIVSLRCIHSIVDLMKAMDAREKKSEETGGEEKLEVTDLMSRLMSGDTLSTDELMALRRN
ncbi:MAG: coiled-coil protein [Candidatus Thalassarchaeum sp.]